MNFLDAMMQLKRGFTIESELMGGYSLRLLTKAPDDRTLEVDMLGNLYWYTPAEFTITLEMMLADWEIVKND